MDKRQAHRTRLRITAMVAAVLATGLLSGLPAIAYSAFPPNYTAHYDVEKYNIIVGRSTISLNQTEDKIHYSQVVKLVGLVSLFKSDRVAEDSWITKTSDKHFLLEKYQYIHTNSSRNRDVLIEGDWSQTDDGQVTGVFKGTVYGKEVTVQTNNTIWDNFSFQLALINDVSNKRKILSYDVISRGEIKKYTFSMLDSEQIEIDDRQYNAVKLERNDGEKTILIWLAPELHYIPVMIETYKDHKLKTRMIIDTVQFASEERTDE